MATFFYEQVNTAKVCKVKEIVNLTREEEVKLTMLNQVIEIDKQHQNNLEKLLSVLCWK
jgi:hypothetical protein